MIGTEIVLGTGSGSIGVEGCSDEGCSDSGSESVVERETSRSDNVNDRVSDVTNGSSVSGTELFNDVDDGVVVGGGPGSVWSTEKLSDNGVRGEEPSGDPR